jgi:hypothetical protein
MITRIERESRRTAMNHRPIAIGMVLCEQVIVEEGTHNVTPVNCFNVRELDTLPSPATFFALVWLADGLGEMLAEIVVERLDTLEEVYRNTRKLVFTNRLQDSRCLARIRIGKFPVVGYYQVSLIVDRELIAQRKFRVQAKGGQQ